MEPSFADKSRSERSGSGAPVGVLLRQTRERLGEPLDRVAEALRIRRVYLEAIEAGRTDDLPGGAYAIGFVRAYADHLGLHAEEVVRRFKDETQSPAPSSNLEFPMPAGEGGVPAGALVGLALVLAACAYGGWYWLSSLDRPVAELIPDIPERLTTTIGSPPPPPPVPVPANAPPPDMALGPDAEDPSEAAPDPATRSTPSLLPGAAPSPPAAASPAPERDAASAPASPSAPPSAPPGASTPAAAPTPPTRAVSSASALSASTSDPVSTQARAGASSTPPAGGTAPEASAPRAAPDSDPAAQDGADEQPVVTMAPPRALGAAVLPPPSGQAGEATPRQTQTPPQATPPAAAPAMAPAVAPSPSSGTTTPTAPTPAPAGTSAPAVVPSKAPTATPAIISPTATPTPSVRAAVPPAPTPPDPLPSPDPLPFATPPAPTSPPLAAPPATTPATTPGATSATTPEPTTPVGQQAPVAVRSMGGAARVVLRASSDSWIMLRKDGKMVVRRLLRKDDVYAIPESDGLTLSVSNAGALEVYVDGVRAPALGGGSGGVNGVRLDPNRLKSGH